MPTTQESMPQEVNGIYNSALISQRASYWPFNHLMK